MRTVFFYLLWLACLQSSELSALGSCLSCSFCNEELSPESKQTEVYPDGRAKTSPYGAMIEQSALAPFSASMCSSCNQAYRTTQIKCCSYGNRMESFNAIVCCGCFNTTISWGQRPISPPSRGYKSRFTCFSCLNKDFNGHMSAGCFSCLNTSQNEPAAADYCSAFNKVSGAFASATCCACRNTVQGEGAQVCCLACCNKAVGKNAYVFCSCCRNVEGAQNSIACCCCESLSPEDAQVMRGEEGGWNPLAQEMCDPQ